MIRSIVWATSYTTSAWDGLGSVIGFHECANIEHSDTSVSRQQLYPDSKNESHTLWVWIVSVKETDCRAFASSNLLLM